MKDEICADVCQHQCYSDDLRHTLLVARWREFWCSCRGI